MQQRPGWIGQLQPLYFRGYDAKLPLLVKHDRDFILRLVALEKKQSAGGRKQFADGFNELFLGDLPGNICCRSRFELELFAIASIVGISSTKSRSVGSVNRICLHIQVPMQAEGVLLVSFEGVPGPEAAEVGVVVAGAEVVEGEAGVPLLAGVAAIVENGQRARRRGFGGGSANEIRTPSEVRRAWRLIKMPKAS